MKAILQRVKFAKVEVGGETVGEIGQGFLVLLGVAKEDDKKEAEVLSNKIAGLRVFTDENDKMNLSLDVHTLRGLFPRQASELYSRSKT